MLADVSQRTYRSQTNVEDGEVVLQTPWPLTPEDLEHLEDWLALCQRVIRRVSEKAWSLEIHPLAAHHHVGEDVRLSA